MKWAGIDNVLILHKWPQTAAISSRLGKSFFFMSCGSKEISDMVCCCGGGGITSHVVRDDDVYSNKFLQLVVNVCVDVLLYCNIPVLNCAVVVEEHLQDSDYW